MSGKKARKKLFIDPKVQGAILRRIMCHWLLSLVVICGFLFLMQVLLDGAYQPFAFHLKSIWQDYGLLFVTLVCLFPVFGYDAIKLSHRFAGPMVSFRRTLKALADGEQIRSLAFRKKDFWHPLAVDLNRVADRIHELEKQIEALKKGESVNV